MNEIELKDLPIPPSANSLHFNRKETGGFGRGRTSAYQNYLNQMRIWSNLNQHSLSLARAITLDLRPGQALRIDQAFFFTKESILSKSGVPKRNDVFNRIKALHDALSQLLGIDDKMFWEGYTTKRLVPNEMLPPYCHVRIRVVETGA